MYFIKNKDFENFVERLERVEKGKNCDEAIRKLEQSITLLTDELNHVKTRFERQKEVFADEFEAINARLATVIRIKKREEGEERKKKPLALEPISGKDVVALMNMSDEERKALMTNPEELKKLGIDLDNL